VDFEYPALLVEKELLFSVTLRDCKVDTFSAGGPGGQHQNTSNTGVRITHRESGATGESRESRSQLQSKKAAFRRMAESQKFQLWLKKKSWGNPEPAEQRAEKDMDPSNLLIMGRPEGRWKIID
jgi:protein subunit release factor B